MLTNTLMKANPTNVAKNTPNPVPINDHSSSLRYQTSTYTTLSCQREILNSITFFIYDNLPQIIMIQNLVS